MDTHLQSNEVFTISSLHTVHSLRLFKIIEVLSGDDELRSILHSLPVCSFINLLITPSHCMTLGSMSSTLLS